MARKKMVAASRDGLPDELFIGEIVMVTHPDEEVSGSKAAKVWIKHGLDTEKLPDTRSGVHVFETECRKVETRKRSNGGSLQIKVDRVRDDKQACAYQITRQMLDAGEHLIEHPKAMRVCYDKATERIDVDPLEPEHYDALREIEERIRKGVDANAKKLTGQKIRNAVRDTLLEMGAVNMRGKAGGVYFVPRQFKFEKEDRESGPILDGLAGALTEMYGPSAHVDRIPMVGDEGRKEIVRKHFAINANTRAEELAIRAQQRARTDGERGIRSDFVANIQNERRRLLSHVDEFDALVQLERKDIDHNLKLLDKALEELMEAQQANVTAKK